MAANYDIFAGDDDNINHEEMFQDMSVDYLSVTGYNYGGAKDKVSRSTYDGWYNDRRSMRGEQRGDTAARTADARDLGGNRGTGRDSFIKTNAYGWQKHNSSGGLAGFNDEFYRGIGGRMSLDSSSNFLLNRMQSDQSTYDTYLADSLQSRANYDKLAEGMDAQDLLFQQQEQNLNVLRGQAQQSNTTTSVGAYAQAARKQMESTNRYMNTLSSFSAPDAMEINPYFVDPLTGKQRHMTDEFDEEAHYNAFETQADVRAFVTDEFTTRQRAIQTEIFNERVAEMGFSEEQGRRMLNGEDLLAEANVSDNLYTNDFSNMNLSMLSDGTYVSSQNRKILHKFKDEEFDKIRRFSEARTIAEMMGNTKGYWTKTHQNETTAITGTESIMRLLDRNDRNQDFTIEKFLEETSEDTFNRFTIQNLNNMEAMRGEYGRRQEAAQSQVTNVELRNELSKKRKEQVLMQQRKTQQLFEQQQQEYQSTLGGLGAKDEDMSGNITFTAVRPQ
jgi:hypothetical protein